MFYIGRKGDLQNVHDRVRDDVGNADVKTIWNPVPGRRGECKLEGKARGRGPLDHRAVEERRYERHSGETSEPDRHTADDM